MAAGVQPEVHALSLVSAVLPWLSVGDAAVSPASVEALSLCYCLCLPQCGPDERWQPWEGLSEVHR